MPRRVTDLVPATPGAARGANGSRELTSELSGFRRGYGILPGALAAVNDGGFSAHSSPWPTATMGSPNAPTALAAAVVPSGDGGGSGGGGTLQLTWRTPDWGGGYPLSHYTLL
eukprot:5283752-Prymnesium_polylepis.2